MGDTARSRLLSHFDAATRTLLNQSPRALDAALRDHYRGHWFWVGCSYGVGVPLAIFCVYALVAEGHHVALGFFVAGALFRPLGLLASLPRGEPLRRTSPSQLGALWPADIHTLSQKVAKALRNPETPNVYVVDSPWANAMSVNSWLANAIPRLNAIYFHGYLLSALERDEVRAVAAHELGHFHRYTSPVWRSFGMLSMMAGSTVMALGLAYPRFVVHAALWSASTNALLGWLPARLRHVGRMTEIACDCVAAEAVGPTVTINALLKISDRAEIQQLLENRLANLLEDNPRADVGDAIRIWTGALGKRPLSLAEARELLVEADARLSGKKGPSATTPPQPLLRRRRLRAALKRVHWSSFDSIEADATLCEEELSAFVHRLVAEPLTATHAVAEAHPDEEPLQVHPATKTRIAYLYLHYVLDGGAPPGERILPSAE